MQEEKIKVNLFRGLGRTLSLAFLTFALIPMILIGMISYNEAHDSLDWEIKKGLKNATKLKTREIRAYFGKMLSQLRLQSDTEVNVKLLEELSHAYETSNWPLEKFVKTYRWAVIVDRFSEDLLKFHELYDYRDILLINKRGDVLYSTAQEADLGSNLFTGDSANTKFAAACKRALQTGKLSFSDYEHYKPSGNRVAGFIVSPAVNQNGDRVGVMAFRISIDPITQLMKSGIELGKTANVYLVGPDLTLRSNLMTDQSAALIEKSIQTDQTKKFRHEGSVAGDRGRERAFVYRGPLGTSVLGVRHEFAIENVRFLVIAEIDESEAFGSVFGLRNIVELLTGLTGIVVVLFVFFIVRRIVKPVVLLSSSVKRVKRGDYSSIAEIRCGNEIGELANSFAAMTKTLRDNRHQKAQQEWFTKGQMELNNLLRGELELSELCREIVTFLTKYIDGHIGVLYLAGKDARLTLTGSYAFSTRKHIANSFEFGQGLVGQAALEKRQILLTKVPEDYISIRSGLGERTPCNIVVLPVLRNDIVLCVIEIGTLEPFDSRSLQFLDLVAEHISISLQTSLAHIRVQELLEESQTQTEELATQQEELRQSNQELEEQTKALKRSEADLQEQQEELRQTNEELEEQTQLLEEQKNATTLKNRQLEETRIEIERKARELDAASRYKSEFLANMSHELRTPLNSILLLSKFLADNREGNLTAKQKECAATVNSSGSELLLLIDEILDLAKVESGKMMLEGRDFPIKDIVGSMERNFRPLAESKGVAFDLHIAKSVPESIHTDGQRLAQILKNLLSNAFKFTERGSVQLKVDYGSSATPFLFSVQDTGTGIPEDKLETVFQAFKQADGSTSRKYGGTGLGLSISRELAFILGGALKLSSTFGQGSTFTLSLPNTLSTESGSGRDILLSAPDGRTRRKIFENGADRTPVSVETGDSQSEPSDEIYVPDDRDSVTTDSRSILIVEDDAKFAKILRDSARERGFKTLVADSGEKGLQLTDTYTPDGIVLDMGLPGMNGKTVLSRLKENLSTRHIPVHIVSAADISSEPLRMGAVGFITKPVSMKAIDSVFTRLERVRSRKIKNVLVVEDNREMRDRVIDLVADDAVKVVTATTGKEAKTLLAQKEFDCIILDLGLPDMNGKDFLAELRKENHSDVPVIIHTAKELTPEEMAMLDAFTGSVIKKDGKSQERLLDDICLFLHRIEKDLPEEKKRMVRKLHNRERILENKRILIVDDDMRNVYSLISILEDHGIVAATAANGREALKKIEKDESIDLILMDIMMPEMNGYEAMRRIRKMNSKIRKIPIIALTAKAMKGDRAKCINAGASDYLSKPVDVDKLMSMLRVWLY